MEIPVVPLFPVAAVETPDMSPTDELARVAPETTALQLRLAAVACETVPVIVALRFAPVAWMAFITGGTNGSCESLVKQVTFAVVLAPERSRIYLVLIGKL